MLKHAGGVEFRDAEIRDSGDRVQGCAFGDLLFDLAGLPGSSGGAEHEIQVRLAGLRNRDGGFDGLDGSEDSGKRVENSEKGVHAPMMVHTRISSGPDRREVPE